MNDVRTVLKDIISTRGFNQSAIARKANISKNKLNAILHLRQKLEANDMFAICDAMGIPYSELRPR